MAQKKTIVATHTRVRIFGSKAYAHVPKELRRKLDEKVKEIVFVGYAEDAKGYRLLNKSTDKVIVSRDVNFLEDGSEAKEVIIQNKQEQETQHNVANIYKTKKKKMKMKKAIKGNAKVIKMKVMKDKSDEDRKGIIKVFRQNDIVV